METARLNRIFNSIDPAEVTQLALDLCRIPSPTGEEGQLSDFMIDWFRKYGLIGIRQEVEAGRANAIGILCGCGEGPSLMLNGHMDTGVSLRYEELTGPVPPKPPTIVPYRADDILYGTGMDNMKSGLAAIMSAAKAIKVSGIPIQGDLIVAGVVGEVSRAPVDQYQGPPLP